MKTFLITIFLITGFLSASTQQPQQCDFFNNIKFKNGKAVIVIKASHQSLYRAPDELIIKKLADKKQLRFKDYFTYSKCCGWEGSAISFYAVNCSKTYVAYLPKKTKNARFETGSTYYLTCTVYEEKAIADPVLTVIDISEKAPE